MWLVRLFPRTMRRENRCPLTHLAHFYTSDRHENWWVYRFEVAEHDAGDSKSNRSLVLPQFAKYCWPASQQEHIASTREPLDGFPRSLDMHVRSTSRPGICTHFS